MTLKITDEMRAGVIALRHSNASLWSYNALARAFGISDTSIIRILNPDFVDKRRNHDNRPAGKSASRARMVVERDAQLLMRRIPQDSRDVTGVLMNDPLPGRSALDQRMGRAG